MKRFIKKFVLTTGIILLFLLSIWIGDTVYTKINEKNLENIAITQLNQNIKKYSSNLKTEKMLKHEKINSITIETDNQGSGNILYYSAKINNRYYGITYECKHNKTYLQSIKLID